MKEKWLYAANLLVSRFINAGRREFPKQIRSVLIVKWDEIGDMATAIHVFDLIKTAYPKSEISVLCKPFVATLIENHPSIFRVTNYRIILPLIEPYSGGVSGARDLMNKRKLYPNEVDRAIAEAWKRWALEGCSGDVLGFAILHTGARSVLRRWPVSRYAELSQWLLVEKKLMPIWVGTQEERTQIQEAMNCGGEGKVWISGETLPASAALLPFFAFIQYASLYIGNESGPLQLADIAQVPLVAIYGPGVPHVFYPLSERSRVLHEILSCNPCNQVVCSQPLDRCIDRVTLVSVQLAVNQILETTE